MKRTRIYAPIIAICLSILACNLPGGAEPTPVLFPTPDLTMTAIFAPVATAVSAAESATALPSETPLPTATNTQVPPTETPTSTATSIPPTATTAPTNTPVSYVGPAKRPGASIQAHYLQAEPNIDGVFDEWSLDRYTIDRVVYGGGSRSGDADLSGRVMFAWDDNYLYIAARILDDTYVQNASGELLYRGDSVEVLLDKNVAGDYYLASLSADDYQLGVSPGKGGPSASTEAYLWYPRSKEGSYGIVKAAATSTDGGYRLEIKIPWSIYGIDPDIGQHYGFAFSISDNDRSGENVQQSMVSNVSTRTLTDPTTWGDLSLVGSP